MKQDNKLRIGALEILRDLDAFSLRIKDDTQHFALPQVIQIPVFQGRRLRSRVANRIVKLPLRVVRKSTSNYHNYQRDINYELQAEIERLKHQIQQIQQIIDDRE